MRRARLVINRPGAPQVRTIWPLDDQITRNPRFSVFDLLTDINDVFPLDNTNLGLEDYTVELGGCGLIHFMPIQQLICDNDELTIRPLSQIEVREHVKGGRRQLSHSGRKLQDGVAFGRNFIAPAPDRPRIEGGDRPAKRRKTTQNNDYEDSELDLGAWGPIVVPQGRRAIETSTPKSTSSPKSVHFEDDSDDVDGSSSALVLTQATEDSDEDEDEDSDEDFDPDEMGDEDESEDEEKQDSESEDDSDSDDGSDSEGEGEDVESESEEDEDGPTAKLDHLLRSLNEAQKSLKEPADPSGQPKKELTTKTIAKSQESRISLSTGSSIQNQAAQAPKLSPSKSKTSLPVSNPIADVKSDEDEDDSSSESSDSSEEESDGDSEVPDSEAEAESEDSSDASSSSDSSSDSSEDEEEQEESSDTLETEKKSNRLEKLETSERAEKTDKPEEISSKIPVEPPKPPPSLPPMVTTTKEPAPFQGSSATKSRNQRRKESKALERLIREGALPPGSTKEDLRLYKEKVRRDNGEISDTTSLTPSERDAPPDYGSETDAPGQSPVYRPMEPLSLEVIIEEAEHSIQVPATSQPQPEPAQIFQSQETSSSPLGTSRRRLGVSDAAKRMIHSGIGIRKPRNEAGEEKLVDGKLREDWKKANSQLASNKSKGYLERMAGTEGVHSKFDENGEVTVHDPDAWKEKIKLSAVECDDDHCNAGDDRLPLPSFPFDQRQLWKPETASNKKSKKKKKNRNKRKHNEEEPYEEGTWDANYYDDSSMQVDSAQRPGQAERSTQGTDSEIDDLPPIPEDLSEYPLLKEPVLPGTIVVFKKLMMDNNYNPVYEPVTVKILSVDGPNLKSQLAKRNCRKVTYDEETGERKFGRFHMPGTEDDDLENGIEYLNIELMPEARVIKQGTANETASLPRVEEEEEIDLVPETILGGSSLDKDNVHIEFVSQLENGDVTMLEAAPIPILPVPEITQNSSSFVEPHFQTNGSDGHLDTDDEMAEAPEEGNATTEFNNDEHAYSEHSSNSPIVNHAPEEPRIDSSAEAHRYDDAPSQDFSLQDIREGIWINPKNPSLIQEEPEVHEESSHPEAPQEPSIQVPGTPSPVPGSPIDDIAPDWDLSVDISGLNPSEVETVRKMVEVKKECPEDTELLREALKPFHHPQEVTQDDINISVDISPPVSPLIKQERLSTQEALSPIASPIASPLASPIPSPLASPIASPIAAPQFNTEHMISKDNIEKNAESRDKDGGAADTTALGSGPGPEISGNQSLSPNDSDIAPFKSDGTFKRRQKVGVLWRKRPSAERQPEKEVTTKREDVTGIDNHNGDDDDNSMFPSTMPERSLASGKIAISGRNDGVRRNSHSKAFPKSYKELEVIELSSGDEALNTVPTSTIQTIGGNASKSGKVKLKPALIKRQTFGGGSQAPQSSSQGRSVSSQF